MSSPTLTVAVLTRNRLSQLKKALGGLARQEPPPDEVLIVDTGSTDGTREWVGARAEKEKGVYQTDQSDRTDRSDEVGKDQEGQPNSPDLTSLSIRLLEDSGRGAYAGVRNRAVRAARGDLIAFLDDDCEPGAHWVPRILDRFAADPDLDVLGGATLPARALDFPDSWPPEVNWVIGLSGPGCWGPDAGRVDLGQTSNIAFRRRAWEAVKFGELGEKDFAEGGAVYDSGREDVDWWRRLRRMGWKAELDGKLIAWHDISPRRLLWKEALDRARRDGRSHWRRAGTVADARAAASDIVHAPVRFFTLLARPGTSATQAYRHVRLWSARQAALLDAAVTSWDKPLHPQDRTKMYVGESLRMVAGVGKWAGRSALAALHRRLRHTKPIPTLESPAKTLLLVSHGYLGDQLLVQPALGVLRESFPDTELVLLTGRFGDELYGEKAPKSDRRWVDRVVDANDWGGLVFPRGAVRLRQFVTDLNPGAIVVFYAHGLVPGPLFFAANAPVIGHDRDQGFSQQLWSDLLTVRIEKDWSIHEILNHARLARVLGAQGDLLPYTLTIPDETAREVDEVLRGIGLRTNGKPSGREFIVMNPGAGQGYKEWPAARWFRLAQWIEKETPYDVVFTGGRAERILVERFQSRGLHAHNLCGWSLRPTAALLRRARLLVTADSGPKHLAMAVGAPTLTLHGPTEEWRWGALWNKERHRVLRCGVPDLTQEDLRGLPGNWIMRLIEVQDVQDTLTEMLG